LLNSLDLGEAAVIQLAIDRQIPAVCIDEAAGRRTTKIILPLGISFYVFITLSYILDIYKKSLSAHKNVMEVLLSLGFSLILLAGPIQRPSTLLPQITRKREFNYQLAVDGLRQILWGLFAKIVIADKLVPLVDEYITMG